MFNRLAVIRSVLRAGDLQQAENALALLDEVEELLVALQPIVDGETGSEKFPVIRSVLRLTDSESADNAISLLDEVEAHINELSTSLA